MSKHNTCDQCSYWSWNAEGLCYRYPPHPHHGYPRTHLGCGEFKEAPKVSETPAPLPPQPKEEPKPIAKTAYGPIKNKPKEKPKSKHR
jgi:hypothetical protein